MGFNTLQDRVGLIDRDLRFQNAEGKSKKKVQKIITPRQIKLKQTLPSIGRANSKGLILPEISLTL